MAKLTAAQKQILRTRRSAQIAFISGAVVSLGANIVAAEHTPLGVIVGAWPAVALLVSVYLFENAPKSFWIKVAVLGVAAIAAWVSYWHMVEVVSMAGESQVTAHIMPFTVDAMMALATAVLNKPIRKAAPARRTSAPVRRLRAA